MARVDDGLGDSGAAFSGDLNELAKVAVNHLPAGVDGYDGDTSNRIDDTFQESDA